MNKLYVCFSLDNTRFAVRSDVVVEIIPIVNVMAVPRTADAISGLLHYRGQTIPTIDLSLLFYDKACRKTMSTRILVAQHQDTSGQMKTIALIAEKINQVTRIDQHEIREHEMTQQQLPCLGQTVEKADCNIQIIQLDKLIKQFQEQLQILCA